MVHTETLSQYFIEIWNKCRMREHVSERIYTTVLPIQAYHRVRLCPARLPVLRNRRQVFAQVDGCALDHHVCQWLRSRGATSSGSQHVLDNKVTVQIE